MDDVVGSKTQYKKTDFLSDWCQEWNNLSTGFTAYGKEFVWDKCIAIHRVNLLHENVAFHFSVVSWEWSFSRFSVMNL